MLSVLAAAATPTPAAAEYRRDGVLLGGRRTYTIRVDDSLFEVARRHGLGYTEIAAANPGVDPFVPEPGRRIVLPAERILPDVRNRKGIIITIPEMRLFLLPSFGAKTVATVPIGVGDEGTETPVGEFSIVEKIRDPAWNVPKSMREERPDLPGGGPPCARSPRGSGRPPGSIVFPRPRSRFPVERQPEQPAFRESLHEPERRPRDRRCRAGAGPPRRKGD